MVVSAGLTGAANVFNLLRKDAVDVSSVVGLTTSGFFASGTEL